MGLHSSVLLDTIAPIEVYDVIQITALASSVIDPTNLGVTMTALMLYIYSIFHNKG